MSAWWWPTAFAAIPPCQPFCILFFHGPRLPDLLSLEQAPPDQTVDRVVMDPEPPGHLSCAPSPTPTLTPTLTSTLTPASIYPWP